MSATATRCPACGGPVSSSAEERYCAELCGWTEPRTTTEETEAIAERLDDLADEILRASWMMERAAEDRVGPGPAARLRAVALFSKDAANLVHRAAGQHRAGKGAK